MDVRASSLLQLFTYVLPLQGNPNRRQLTSSATLLIANLVPIAGVLFFGWRPGTVLVMYWVESAAVAFYNVLKMVASSAYDSSGRFEPLGIAGGVFLSAFFAVHFGIFMFVHAVFLLGLMASGFIPAPPGWTLSGMEIFTAEGARSVAVSFLPASVDAIPESPLPGVTAIFVSHGISFVIHFLREKQYVTARTATLMMSPYGRIVVMQITIMAGMFLLAGAQKAGFPGPVFVIVMVVMKTIVDLRTHWKAHSPAAATTTA